VFGDESGNRHDQPVEHFDEFESERNDAESDRNNRFDLCDDERDLRAAFDWVPRIGKQSVAERELDSKSGATASRNCYRHLCI
jgi:hypothetical protein